MAASLHQRLDTLMLKARLLTDRYKVLQQEKRAAEERIADMQRVINTQQKELAELRQRIEYLTVVTTMTPRRDKVEQTRTVLADLVREIDKCINELNQ